MFHFINFDNILPIWQYYLWPERKSVITGNSAMNYLGGYDIKNLNFTPVFIAYFMDNQIVGVNSGHKCHDNSFRSRGLYVFPNYRKKGVGIKLLTKTIEIAIEQNANFIWSYPRQASWSTYEKSSFVLSSDWEKSELGFNAYCIKNLKE